MKNRELKISTALSKTSARWTNQLTTLQDLTAKAYEPIVVDRTTTEYQALPKGEKDKHKDVGGFVGGHLKNGRRREATHTINDGYRQRGYTYPDQPNQAR